MDGDDGIGVDGGVDGDGDVGVDDVVDVSVIIFIITCCKGTFSFCTDADMMAKIDYTITPTLFF
jgi:hypothetical protein